MNEEQIRLAKVAAAGIVVGITIGVTALRKDIKATTTRLNKQREVLGLLREAFEWGTTTDPIDVGGRDEWERIAAEKLAFIDVVSES